MLCLSWLSNAHVVPVLLPSCCILTYLPPCSLTPRSCVPPADAQMLVLFQDNASKEAFYKKK